MTVYARYNNNYFKIPIIILYIYVGYYPQQAPESKCIPGNLVRGHVWPIRHGLHPIPVLEYQVVRICRRFLFYGIQIILLYS